MTDFSDQYVTKLPLSEVFRLNNTFTEEIDRSRISNYGTNWRYYYGAHYKYYNAESEDETPMTLNFIRPLVNKLVTFTLFGGVNFISDKISSEVVSPILEEIWEYNEKDVILYEMALSSSVTGDNFVGVEWDNDDQNVVFNVLDPSTCFPVWDVLDKRKLKEFWISIPKENSGAFKDDVDSYRTYKRITDDVVEIWENGAKVTSDKNPYGFINILHWPNLLIPFYFYGESDINSDLIKIVDAINEKASNINSIINYHETPITVIIGAKANNIPVGANRVWGGLPKDAQVFNLSLNSDLSASLSYIALLKKSFHEISGIPERAFGGEVGGISNTSSVALHVEYMPLLERLYIKRALLAKGLSKLNSMALKVYAVINPDVKKLLANLVGQKETMKYNDGGKARTKIVRAKPLVVKTKFGDPLPKDKLVQLQMVTQMLDATIGDTPMPLISMRRAMEELGTDDIDDVLAEVEYDMKKVLKLKEAQLKVENKMAKENRLVKGDNIAGVVGEESTPRGAVNKELRGK